MKTLLAILTLAALASCATREAPDPPTVIEQVLEAAIQKECCQEEPR